MWQNVLELILFSCGLLLGIVPCYLWGRIGGDERWYGTKRRWLLHAIHHWELGLCGIAGTTTLYFIYGYSVFFTVGLGFWMGTTLDDLLFHSFAQYFKRKDDDKQ